MDKILAARGGGSRQPVLHIQVINGPVRSRGWLLTQSGLASPRFSSPRSATFIGSPARRS